MKWRYFKKVNLEKSLVIKGETSDDNQQCKTISELMDEKHFKEREYKFTR